jgi:hypothetical protein
MTNTSTRPAITGGTTPQPYEIRSFSSTSLGSDDGFLQLRTGGGTNANQVSFISLAAASTVPDMDKNIVLGTGGLERLRITNSGLNVTGNITCTGNFTVPPKSGTIAYSGTGWTTTLAYSYTKTGNTVNFLVNSDLLTKTFTGTGTISVPLGDSELGISPQSGYVGYFHIQVGSSYRMAVYQIQPSGNLIIYKDANFATFVNGDTVFWYPQSLVFHM